MKYIVSEAAKAAEAELEPLNISEIFAPPPAERQQKPEQFKPKESVVIVNKHSSNNTNVRRPKNIRIVSNSKPK